MTDYLAIYARRYNDAVKIISDTLSEISPTSLSRENIEHNAHTILARLAKANITLDRDDYSGAISGDEWAKEIRNMPASKPEQR